MKVTRYTLACAAAFAAATATAQTELPAIEKYKLKNGMEVIITDHGTLPVTSLSFYINVGKENETPGQQALASITAGALSYGNQVNDRVEQDKLVNEMGGKFSAESNDNYTQVDFMFPNTSMDKAVELMSNILLKPKFAQEDLQQQVQQMLNYNNPAKMDITALASMFSDLFVYGSAHPLGRHFYTAQLSKITPAQVQEFYKFNYTPKNTRLVISGKTDRDKIKKLVEQHFGGWTAEFGEINSAMYEMPAISKKEYAFVNKSKATQASLRWTKKAPSAGSKDVIPFRIAALMFNTLLFDEIRAKEGKTYGINLLYNEDNNNGTYAVASQVRNEVMHGTILSFDRVLKEFYDKGITEEKLRMGKASLKNELLSIEDPLQFTDFINPLLYDYNKRKEYLAEVEKVDLATVNKAIKKYFDPSSYKLVIAGDEAVLTDQLSKIANLQKFSLKAIEVDQ
jgi:zinc protease